MRPRPFALQVSRPATNGSQLPQHWSFAHQPIVKADIDPIVDIRPSCRNMWFGEARQGHCLRQAPPDRGRCPAIPVSVIIHTGSASELSSGTPGYPPYGYLGIARANRPTRASGRRSNWVTFCYTVFPTRAAGGTAVASGVGFVVRVTFRSFRTCG